MAKILIIDDDAMNLQIYITKLQEENYEVNFCSDSECALTQIKDQYNLILLDIMMPKIDGIQLLKQIKKSVNKDCTILIYTNLISPLEKEECLNLGVKEYLIKADFTPTQLVEKIKKYLS